MPPMSPSPAIAALLEFAREEPDVRVRLAALAATLHLELTPAQRGELAQATCAVIDSFPAAAYPRHLALALAARIPQRSLRERLHALAADPAEADAEAVASALEAAGDPIRIVPLLAGLHQGRTANYRLLAALPIERALESAAQLPEPRNGIAEDARFWWALARARLGDLSPLESLFYADDNLPFLFWDEPWSAYEQIAAIKPLPPRQHAQLLALLAQADADEAAGTLDPEQARALRLTVWAATGTADAEGTPLRALPAAGHPGLEVPGAGHLDIAALLAGPAADTQPVPTDAQLAALIAGEPAAYFIPRLLALAGPERPSEARIRALGLIALAADLRAGRPVAPHRRAADFMRNLPRPEPVIDAQVITAARAADDLTAAPSSRPQPASRARAAHGARSMAAPHTGAGEADQRRVNALIIVDGLVRLRFVAGRRQFIRCWIGLPQAQAAAADAPIPTVDIPDEGLALSVELCWQGQGAAGLIHLPAKRSARSEDCDLPIDVPEGIDQLEAELLFRFKGKVFEAVRLTAAVEHEGRPAATGADLQLAVQFGQRAVIELPERSAFDATITFGSAEMRVFAGKGGKIFDLGSTSALVRLLNDKLFLKDVSLVRRRSQQGVDERDAVLDADDPDVLELFCDLARHGATLYQDLRSQGFVDPGERLQLVNHDPKRYVPLEFVYDRGFPRRGARLCAGWQAVLGGEAVRCPACDATEAAAAGGGRTDTICPLGFWSIRKVIERTDPARLQDLSTPTAPRRRLRALNAALCASSDKVPEDNRAELGATLAAAIPAATVVSDWAQWEAAVARDAPPLLILLAHHDLDDGLDYLEIGSEALDEELKWRFRPELNERLINPPPVEPGPIVLLLGCLTAADNAEMGYSGLANTFTAFRAGVVLGTLAKILGRHAAPLASELVSELVAVDMPDADFGTVMRRVRRRMLGRGYLMALSLVSLGDAEWHLPQSRPGQARPPADTAAPP